MDFDIVLVTRNRLPALRISVPLMLSQSRLPKRFIVVDASDDHNSVKQTIEGLVDAASVDIDLQILRSDAGSSRQRNVGLCHVASPVIFFPDDDALWFPGFAENVMQIYERDREGIVGAVCGTEVLTPPPTGCVYNKPTYRMESRDRLQLMIGRYLDKIENAFFRDPLFVESDERYRKKKVPTWVNGKTATLSGPMTGFRMTFRTDVILSLGFDEVLGRYALFEDRDASLGVLANFVIVRALRAKVFHYRVPEKRVDGIEWGAIHVLNRAYVVCKHAPPGARVRSLLMRFSYYKVARYLLQAHTQYGRQRVKGAWRATSRVPQLLDKSERQLLEHYLEIRAECVSPSQARR